MFFCSSSGYLFRQVVGYLFYWAYCFLIVYWDNECQYIGLVRLGWQIIFLLILSHVRSCYFQMVSLFSSLIVNILNRIVNFGDWGVENVVGYLLVPLCFKSFFYFNFLNCFFTYRLFTLLTIRVVRVGSSIFNSILSDGLLGNLTFVVLFCSVSFFLSSVVVLGE